MSGAALGNTTKSASTSAWTGVSEAAAQAAVRRWDKWKLRDVVGTLLPTERVVSCGHKPVPGKSVALAMSPEGVAYYANLRRCGSVWVCPDCAAKISRARAEELRRAVAVARARGLVVTLVTFTVGHSRKDDLAGLLRGLTEAQRRWRGGRAWQTFARSYGYVGSVRNLEVTWGDDSGWHPHSHALLFTKKPITEARAQWLAERWVACVEAEGGYASVEHGLKLSDVDASVEAYLAKTAVEVEEAVSGRGWGAAEELTYANTKKGRAGGRVNAFGLLRLVAEVGLAEHAAKFIEYAEAFKGKRQLYWSKGLRDLLDLGVAATDEELAEAEGERAEVVYVFGSAEWKAVLASGYREVLLEVAERAGAMGVWEFVDSLLTTGRYPEWDPGAWWVDA